MADNNWLYMPNAVTKSRPIDIGIFKHVVSCPSYGEGSCLSRMFKSLKYRVSSDASNSLEFNLIYLTMRPSDNVQNVTNFDFNERIFEPVRQRSKWKRTYPYYLNKRV